MTSLFTSAMLIASVAAENANAVLGYILGWFQGFCLRSQQRLKKFVGHRIYQYQTHADPEDRGHTLSEYI